MCAALQALQPALRNNEAFAGACSVEKGGSWMKLGASAAGQTPPYPPLEPHIPPSFLCCRHAPGRVWYQGP